jgi:exosortase
MAALAFMYLDSFQTAFKAWLKPVYSHGFLVPFFSAFLIYRSWSEAPRKIRWPNLWGLAFLSAGLAIFFVSGKINVGKEWLQGFSFVINLCGVVVFLGGWSVLKWAWPAVGFLIFMYQLPYSVEIALGGYLQKIAAMASEFVLQTAGFPTYREGVILHVKDTALEVAKACSGLSMLLTFVALSVGMVLIVKRPWLDRTILLLAAIPVAVIANVIRISLTGMLYSVGGKDLGDWIFHDFAGWMMMPIALAILWLLLRVLDWVFVPEMVRASREEVIRANAANPSLLFMHAIPGADNGKLNKPAASVQTTKPTKPAPTAAPQAPLP